MPCESRIPNPESRRALRSSLADVSVRRRQAVERLFGLLAFRALRGHLHELLPRFGGALEIFFTERPDDPEIQQCLGVVRVDLQGMLKLRDGAIGVLVVVVADAE